MIPFLQFSNRDGKVQLSEKKEVRIARDGVFVLNEVLCMNICLTSRKAAVQFNPSLLTWVLLNKYISLILIISVVH